MQPVVCKSLGEICGLRHKIILDHLKCDHRLSSVLRLRFRCAHSSSMAQHSW